MRHINATVVLDPFVSDRHPVSQGNILGGNICVADDGAHFTCVKDGKGVLFAGDRRFGSVAVVPECPVKEVTDFENIFSDKNGVEHITYFNGATYKYNYSAEGTGVFAKLGLIVTPGNGLRIGAAF